MSKNREASVRHDTRAKRGANRTTRWYWERDVAGCTRFLERLDDLVEIHGQVWVDKMRLHYRRKLLNLLEHTPPPDPKPDD